MCTSQSSDKESSLLSEKKYRLADFFDQWWDFYKQSPSEPITPEQYKAVNAMRVCRTEALGVDYYACPECGEITKIYHSCKNRFCPTCSWKDTLKWADKMKKNMMSIPHRHVVITLPHQLNHLIKANHDMLLSILFRTAADTLTDWMQNKYDFRPGIISVLHTFGEVKQYHVHVHMIVSWGGIDNKTKALCPIKGEFVDYDSLKDEFRRKFEAELLQLFDKGNLNHGFSNRIAFLQFLDRINQKRWIIHLEPPMDIPTQVVRYIGRYSKRACLSEYKITSMEGENITFRYKDNKTKDINNKPVERELELNYRDFFPRLLQHVPLAFFRLVRYYGLYSNRTHIPQEYLYNQEQEPENGNIDNRETSQIEETAVNPLICNNCQKKKLYLYTKIKSRLKDKVVIFNRIPIKSSKFQNQQAA